MERVNLRAVQLSHNELTATITAIDVILDRIGDSLKADDPFKYDLMISARQKLYKLYTQPAQAMITA